MSNALQVLVNRGRRLFPRGWSPLLRSMALFLPSLQKYKANLLNGDQMYLDLREIMCHGIFYYGGQPFEYGTEKLFRKILKHGDIVVDVGANVGYYTRLASGLVGSEGGVLAFEPTPVAFRILEMNCSDLNNVKLFLLALSDREEETNFYIRKMGNLSSLDSDSHTKAIKINTVTMDNILKDYARINLLKIDVEGFELEVVRGAQKILSMCRPIVHFEFTQSFANERGFQFKDFEMLFSKYDYTLNWVDHTTSVSIISKTPSNYIVAMPNDRLHLIM